MRKGLLAMAVLAAIASALFASLANAADHRDSPTPTENPSIDISDLYVFRSPANSENVVFVVNVNPFIAPVDNVSAAFDSDARYQIHVDNDGDLADDVLIEISSTESALFVEGLDGKVAVALPPAGPISSIAESGGVRVFAGLRDDPFFFDIPGFQNFLMNMEPPVNGLRPEGGGQPIDAFGGTNVLSVVIEAPVTMVTGAGDANSGSIQTWAESTTGDGARQDRMGQAIFNAALIPPGELKEAFNQASPADDVAQFLEPAVGSVGFLRGVADTALGGAQDGGPLGNLTPQQVGEALTPDVVTVDFSQPVAFPNGRRLSDDALDLTFGIVMNRGGADGVSDGIDANDMPFLSTFPYVAPPHTAADAAEGPITPPATGEGGLLSSGESWALSGVFLAIAVVFGIAAGAMTVRSRAR